VLRRGRFAVGLRVRAGIDVTRLQAIPAAEATPTALADRVDEELNPRLLRRFAPLPKVAGGLDSKSFISTRMSRIGVRRSK
jgi:hypothetical protein